MNAVPDTEKGKLRITAQRKAILEELQNTNTHPTADELYKMVRLRLPRISLGTIYRNLEKLSEEHGLVNLSACNKKPQVGERVTILVNHCCAANNLFNQAVGYRRGEVEVIWPIAARGLLQ